MTSHCGVWLSVLFWHLLEGLTRLDTGAADARRGWVTGGDDGGGRHARVAWPPAGLVVPDSNSAARLSGRRRHWPVVGGPTMQVAHARGAAVGTFTSHAWLPRLTVAQGPQEVLPREGSADPRSPGPLCAPSSDAGLGRGRLQGQAGGALVARRDRSVSSEEPSVSGTVLGGCLVGAGSGASRQQEPRPTRPRPGSGHSGWCAHPGCTCFRPGHEEKEARKARPARRCPAGHTRATPRGGRVAVGTSQLVSDGRPGVFLKTTVIEGDPGEGTVVPLPGLPRPPVHVGVTSGTRRLATSLLLASVSPQEKKTVPELLSCHCVRNRHTLRK